MSVDEIAKPSEVRGQIRRQDSNYLIFATGIIVAFKQFMHLQSYVRSICMCSNGTAWYN